LAHFQNPARIYQLLLAVLYLSLEVL